MQLKIYDNNIFKIPSTEILNQIAFPNLSCSSYQ